MNVREQLHGGHQKVQSGYATDEQRWLALQKRDPAADGQFVYSVTTTGVYCRPVCPSRLARRENVAFHETSTEAERAGFRACRRCEPQGESLLKKQANAVAQACRIIDNSEAAPALEDLAHAVGLSRYHFHRLFKKVAGLTPRQYFAAVRTRRVRSKLKQEPSVTDAIYGAGFSSSSRFYEGPRNTLGMTPSEYRQRGDGVAIGYAIAPCPLGFLLVAGTARGICCVRLGSERAGLEKELREEFPHATIAKGDDRFKTWVNALIAHLKNPVREIDLPLDVRGTAFQQRVWQALREIPAGRTASYAEVAARIGQPSAVRAVARACATNPVAVIVPCHRVIGSDRKLTGYRWGVERKRVLLNAEAVNNQKLSQD